VDAQEIKAALDDVYDQAIVFHAFTDYMRDYEIVTHSVPDPVSGIAPSYDRYLFKVCVEAIVSTAVTVQTWRASLDDRLIDFSKAQGVDGYVWGVRWQCLYPGGSVVENSSRTDRWSEALSLPFHEVLIETNGHNIDLVFSDLEVSTLEPGYAPFVVGREDHYVPPMPLAPDE
jgi:hypothetical protein